MRSVRSASCILRTTGRGRFMHSKRMGELTRCLATGSQCPTCRRHYPTPVQLCRHLKHSWKCRQPLLTQECWSTPEPGQGNRRAIEQGLACAPPLQAEGPAMPDTALFVADEIQRPSAEVLDCLDLLGFDGCPSDLPADVLWDRIRLAFSCVCLPLRRLRLTAEVWRDSVSGGSGDWICHSDIAQWLVPDPAQGVVMSR